MVAFPSGRGDELVVDIAAVGTLIFFLVNLGLATFGYWLWFDPQGTENPGWTAVFG
jgi:hypothetical protein